jgi:2,4-dienoyl-CoA reductase-like NADH-dependent reductase (Old Yellow Enzyme family)
VTSVLDPITFACGKTAKNRVVLAAMTNSQSNADGTIGEAELEWLRVRSRGGFGIVTTCAAHVDPRGQGWPGELGVWSDAHIFGLRRLALALHADGALALVQIFHGGIRADASVTGQVPIGPVAIEGHSVAATSVEVEAVITKFVDAATRIEAAGFDGVEIHGAHGYLLTQFLSKSNTRDDRWGGASLQNRARLMRDVVRAVRANTTKKFLVGIRVSPEDFGNASGLDLDESLEVARGLVEDGIDFLHLSLWDVARNSTKRPDTHVLTEYRRVVPSELPLFVAGKIWSLEDAQRCLELGADAVALGRPAIANPRWPEEVAREGKEPKRPPLTVEELVERGLSQPFAESMRQWKNFVV